MDIISVVLGADTKKDRTRDSIKIIEYAFANYEMIDMAYMMHEKFDNIIEENKFNIIKGKTNELFLKLEENSVGLYPVKKDKIKDINVKVELETIKEAPIYKDDICGTMAINIGEEELYKIKILAKNEVEKKGILDYMMEVAEAWAKNIYNYNKGYKEIH